MNELYHYNKNHDRLGRFASGHGGSSARQERKQKKAVKKELKDYQYALNEADNSRARNMYYALDYNKRAKETGNALYKLMSTKEGTDRNKQKAERLLKMQKNYESMRDKHGKQMTDAQKETDRLIKELDEKGYNVNRYLTDRRFVIEGAAANGYAYVKEAFVPGVAYEVVDKKTRQSGNSFYGYGYQYADPKKYGEINQKQIEKYKEQGTYMYKEKKKKK